MLGKGGATWQVFDINAAQEAQSILVVGGMVAYGLVVLAGEVVKAAVDRGHPREVVQHLFDLLDGLLDESETLFVTGDSSQLPAARVTAFPCGPE